MAVLKSLRRKHMGNVAKNPQPGVPTEGDGGASNVGHNSQITDRPLPTGTDGTDLIEGPANGPDEIQR
jgi:hypothetical protein